MSKKGGTSLKEMIGGCCVCSDERGWSENPLVYCDGAGCNVAVHQACYGIVQVPTGPWFCRKCESQERVARVKCELCPQRAGALKRTDSGGWCHVVCALYVPEAWFANVQTMEPIVLSAVPPERFNKICYICEEQKRDTKATAGACMQCNRNGCKQYFHVTCAQGQGLLCEVTGSYENVKYCGYCLHHYKKLKNHSNVKTIPAFKPIASENSTPDSSPEKNPPVITVDTTLTKMQAPPAIKEVKSPQVDQSVSSTSDSVPPVLVPNSKAEAGPPQVNSTVSRSFSEVSDISSVLSPTGDGNEVKHWNSDQHQEPSSSVPLAEAPSLAKMPENGASSSAETLDDIDVTEPPQPKQTDNSHSTGPKRQKNPSSKASSAVKKNKPGMISSTVPHTSGTSGKERKKNSTRKRKDSGNSNAKAASSSGLPNSSLPGHHDYCGSIFGGSPYFQSLSASGHVSLPSFSSQAYHPIINVGGERVFYGSDYYFDSTPVPNGTGELLEQPPKCFPSLSMGMPKQNQDRTHDFPLSMEQLLEQQWDQGAQFLMEQSQHFDISSLLNCLHRLKGENQNLEDRVKDLAFRRDHLLAVNARLALPLSLQEHHTGSTSKSSSMGSLEDISSPDDAQAPLSLPTVQIPNNTELMVEDILSPAESDETSVSSERVKFGTETTTSSKYSFGDQACPPPQPLMYSVVNPPPPTLSAMASANHNKPQASFPDAPRLSLSMDSTPEIASLSSLHLNSNSTEHKQSYL